MEHVRPAVLGAQRVVLGAAIEDQRTRRLGQIGDRKKIVGEQVGDEEALTVREAFLDRSHHVAVLGHDQLAQGIVMAEKAAGRLIVRDPERGAGQPLVLELARFQQRGRRQLGAFLPGHVDDRDRELLGRRGWSGHPAARQARRAGRRARCRTPGEVCTPTLSSAPSRAASMTSHARLQASTWAQSYPGRGRSQPAHRNLIARSSFLHFAPAVLPYSADGGSRRRPSMEPGFRRARPIAVTMPCRRRRAHGLRRC